MIYLYQNPSTGEIAQVSQGMNDVHEYFRDGQKWNRLFTSSNIGIDTKIDPFSAQKFLEKTSKPGKMGDLWDRSAEWSAMRKGKDGEDKILKKEVDKYEKRFNVKHPSRMRDLE